MSKLEAFTEVIWGILAGVGLVSIIFISTVDINVIGDINGKKFQTENYIQKEFNRLNSILSEKLKETNQSSKEYVYLIESLDHSTEAEVMYLQYKKLVDKETNSTK